MTRRRIPTCVHRTCFPRKLPEPIVRRGQPDPGVPGGTRAPRRGVERIICATSHRVPGSRLTRRPAHRGRGRGTASSVDPSHPRPRGSAPPRQPSTWLPGRSPGGGAGIAAGHPVRDIRADLLRCGGGTPDTPLSACQGHAENERADSCVPFGCASRAAPRGPRSPLGGISEERAHHPRSGVARRTRLIAVASGLVAVGAIAIPTAACAEPRPRTEVQRRPARRRRSGGPCRGCPGHRMAGRQCDRHPGRHRRPHGLPGRDRQDRAGRGRQRRGGPHRPHRGYLPQVHLRRRRHLRTQLALLTRLQRPQRQHLLLPDGRSLHRRQPALVHQLLAHHEHRPDHAAPASPATTTAW